MKLRVVPSALLLILASGYSHLERRGVLEPRQPDPPGCGFTLDNATASNDNGQIVVSGFNAHGHEHAFLLTQLVSAPRTYRLPA